MPWFKVDDTLHSHPKARRAGIAAMGLWALGGSYSMAYKLDGFVPDHFIGSIPAGRKLAGDLVRVGMWEKATRDGDDGWLFHDWEHFQPTADEIERDREKSRERQRQRRARLRGEAVAECVAALVAWVVTPYVTRDTTRDVRRESRHPVPTRPDPSLYVVTARSQDQGSLSLEAAATLGPSPMLPVIGLGGSTC